MSRDVYTDPLVGRYTSRTMQELFSERTRFSLWRSCWIALAEAQRELGLTDVVSAEAVAEMKAHVDDINFDVAEAFERETRHDVMAHIHAYGVQCPKAAGIIHLGATSQYVVCNSDLVIHKRAIGMVRADLVRAIDRLAVLAERHKGLAALGATHFQPAQPVTVGKRIALTIQDLLLDLDALEWVLPRVRALGAKGTTGTQASFMALFRGDHARVEALDLLVAKKLGLDATFEVTGQTYPRKLDTKIAEALAGIGASAHQFGVNVRLLAGLKELDEPFGKKQVGSSAMAYKRNPMRSERMCSLARKLMNLPADFHATHANQWLERTLDDSAIRRMDIPQAYLLADAVLGLLADVAGGLEVHPAAIRRRLDEELPFMATEEILMAAVERGASRQEAHEVIRGHSVEVARAMKEDGKPNDLLARLAADGRLPLTAEEICAVACDPARFTGRAEAQVEAYLANVVRPRLAAHKELLAQGVESRVRV
ncbi:MAG: adenylosuccinate lyase [Deltaproteobacteria bacterium]|nr:adenylosuccinate lyase [Deltaproteobacteria bacterium]